MYFATVEMAATRSAGTVGRVWSLLWALLGVLSLSQGWAGWRNALAIVDPATVIRWHREGFRRFWRRKSSSGRLGRPGLDREVVSLIRRMSQANVTQTEGVRARADAACDRDRATQAEAAAAELRELLEKERGAHLERMRALLARVAPEVATEGESEEQLLARIEVACAAASRDGAWLRACAPWGRA